MNLRLKHKFIIVGSLAAFALLGLLALNQYSSTRVVGLGEIKTQVSQVNAGMLTLRRNEKDFLARLNLKYAQEFNDHFDGLRQQVINLQGRLAANGLDQEQVSLLSTQLDGYAAVFNKLVSVQKKIGLNPEDGLYGSLRDAVHNVEARVEDVNDQQLRADMLELRRNEKDFMLRLDMKYPEKLEKNLKRMMADLDASRHPARVAEPVRKLLSQYHRDFMTLVSANQEKGLTEKDGLQGSMRDTVHQTEDLLVTLNNTIESQLRTVVSSTKKYSFILSLGLVAVIAGALIWLSLTIIRPMTTLAATMQQIARDKNVSHRCKLRNKDEIGDIAIAFNSMMEVFQATVAQVIDSASRLSAEAEELANITSSTRQGVQEQTSQTEQVATAMNEMNLTVREVAKNAEQAAKSATDANGLTVTGQEVVSEAVDGITALAQEIDSAASSIQIVEEDSIRIGTVLDVIHDIAEQTNLLALNAAIEAARAGEQGRGFAVVADEVRTLASRTQQSTQEIQEMIESLQSGTKQAVSVMGHSREMARSSVERANKAGESLGDIGSSVNMINDMNAHIASAATEQEAVSEEINRNITVISQVANESAKGAEQISQASQELANLASGLQTAVAQFKAG